MSYAKVLFLVAGVTVLGMLGAEKLRAQPSPVDCDRYAQDYARNHSRNGSVSGRRGNGSGDRRWRRRPHRRRPAYLPCIKNVQSRVP